MLSKIPWGGLTFFLNVRRANLEGANVDGITVYTEKGKIKVHMVEIIQYE